MSCPSSLSRVEKAEKREEVDPRRTLATRASETALLTTGGRSMKAHMALQQVQALVKGYLENL
jgi:hypothetical protein